MKKIGWISLITTAAELGSLQTTDAGVHLSNASEARVRVSGQLSVSATNASRLRCTGNPASVGVSVTNHPAILTGDTQ